MKILFLGNENNPVIDFIDTRDEVIVYSEPINLEYIIFTHPDFIVSYGYRHIIKSDIIEYMKGKMINLHISYLPFNRGADPNLWSFIDGTPKGVTIHLIDEGIDTGDIIVQKLLYLNEDYSLRTNYQILQNELQNLFYARWQNIRLGRFKTQPQRHKGTFHNSKDKLRFVDGDKYLDIPIRELLRNIFE